MDDLISRQAAIDALGERPLVWDEHTDEYELGQRNQYDSDRAAIETVPSAFMGAKMPRYIDANEFRKRIDHYPPEIRDIAKKELRYTPTADVVERKKGKWIEYNATGKKQWMCSECCVEEKNPKAARFCYWCGADMRGEENG